MLLDSAPQTDRKLRQAVTEILERHWEEEMGSRKGRAYTVVAAVEV